MTGEAGPFNTDAEKPREESAASSSLATLIAVVLAVVAVGAAAYVALQDDPAGLDPASTTPVEPPMATARFEVAYAPEIGPFGQTWQWMRSRGKLLTTGSGRYYVAFRGRSAHGEHRLIVGGAGTVILNESPRAYIAGRVTLTGTPLELRAQPGARRLSKRDIRRVTVSLSGVRLAAEPVAALPGAGFYPEERLPNHAPFQWLRESGVVDVVSLKRSPHRAWVTLVLQSPLERLVLAEVGNARSGDPLALHPWRLAQMTVGPIPVREGHGQFGLDISPGPRPLGADTRPLGVQVLGVTASLRPPAS